MTKPSAPDHPQPGPRRSVGRQTLVNLGLRVIGIPVALLVSAVLSRLLSVEAFGLYGATLAVVLVAAMPVTSALTTLSIRTLGAARQTTGSPADHGLLLFIAQVTAAATLLYAVTVGLLQFLPAKTAQPGVMDTLVHTVWLYPVFIATLVAGAVLRGMQQVTLGVLPDQVLRPAAFLLALGALYACCAISATAAWAFQVQTAATALAAGVTVLAMWRVLVRYRLRPQRAVAPQTRQGMGALLSLGLFQIANTHAPLIILGISGVLVDAAWFRVADQLAGLALVPLMAANLALGPLAAQFSPGSHSPRLQSHILQACKTVWWLSVPGAVILFVFPAPTLALVFGADYQSAAGVLMVLGAGSAISALAGPVGLILNMLGYEKETLRAMRAALLVNVVLTLTLIPVLGAMGAAIAATVSKVLWNAWLMRRLYLLEGYSTVPFVFRPRPDPP